MREEGLYTWIPRIRRHSVLGRATWERARAGQGAERVRRQHEPESLLRFSQEGMGKAEEIH